MKLEIDAKNSYARYTGRFPIFLLAESKIYIIATGSIKTGM